MIGFDRGSSREVGYSLGSRIAAEQIAVLFESVRLAVIAAALASVMLVVIVRRLGYLDLVTGLSWIGYISICACSHILLSVFYRRSESSRTRWRYWAAWFTVISFAEGCGWGWASISLANGGGFQVSSLMALAAGGVAAGCIPAFNPYLPALIALVLTSTMPYAIVSFLSDDKVQQAATSMMLIFACIACSLGALANRPLKQSISLRIKAEELAVDLMHQKERAEKADLAKSNFLAAASHDLRQPIHALGLFVGALSLIPMPADGGRIIDRINESTDALDDLLTALLDISSLDAGVVTVDRRPFAIGPVLTRVCRDYTSEARAKGIALSCIPCRLVVESDPTLVERIARNLVSNAVRYTERGRIVIGCRRRGRHVAVQVWDTGRGIPADLQDSIFQEYYQIGNPERDREKGLGLGLAIVRRLTDLLGCRLALHSEYGRGSCFEVHLSRSDQAAASQATSVRGIDNVFATGFVIVIDDEEAIRAGMTRLLSGWGYEVLAVDSADRAIELLAACVTRPDLLICDFRLRGESGIDAIERLRAEYNEQIPAVLITGDTATERLIKANSSGFILLHKPVPNGKLRATITRLLSAKSGIGLAPSVLDGESIQ